MSIKLMSQVWEKQLTPGQQRVLLVLCDHANDQGTNCYPSIEYVAWKIGITPKTVMAMVNELEKLGAIQVRREHRKRNMYRIRLHNLPDKPPFKKSETDDEGWPDDDFVGSQNVTQENLGSQNVTQKDENVTQGVTKCDPKVEKMLPQPLVNHQSNHEIETLDAASSDADLSGLEGLSSALKKTKKSTTPQPPSPPAPAKDDRRVWGMVDSYFDARGLEGHKMPNSQRHAAYNVFKELAPDYGATAVYGCASYLASQQWYQEPGRLTAKAVSNAIHEWDKKGRPTAEAPRRNKNTAYAFAASLQNVSKAMKEQGL